eukprot:TRINITY_DN7505_c0_g1_i2.p1 TRINITY_DN7505_c0_g1~~TRINITY_DN7505_c0_g1_i2.p1  ORF type:complete len:454 (-),score=93.00 TRINITY_DN7505_c0_g1_i2:13-1302(-)
MSTILNEVLSFQKIEEGKFEMDMKPFNLYKAMKRAASSFKAPLELKRMQIFFDWDHSIFPEVIGDSSRIRQVLQNLISNSIKFSPEMSTISLKARLHSTDDGSSPNQNICFVRISVIDQGVGISQDDIAKLFQPYIQIRPGDLQDGRGSGLGLSICKEIVQAHGGDIGVNSTPGKGAEFYVQIPFKRSSTPGKTSLPAGDDSPRQRRPGLRLSALDTRTDSQSIESDSGSASAQAEAQSDSKQLLPSPESDDLLVQHSPTSMSSFTSSTSATSSGETGNPHTLRFSSPKLRRSTSVDSSNEAILRRMPNGGKVLVVDDVRANRRLLEVALEKLGCKVETASDGVEGLEKIMQSKFDLVFLDNVMPRMSGVDCAKKIRALKLDVKLVGVTGNALAEDIQEFKDAGVNTVLLKPVRIDTLRMTVMELIENC